MKTLNKIFITLASIFALISCEKDGDKIYLQSLGSGELIATTDNVVLTSEMSQKIVLSFAWKGQNVQISDTTVGTATKAKNYMEISLSEDFSGQVYKNETTSNSIAYNGGELNSIVNELGAKVGEANNVFFRLGSTTGENIPYAYSNVVRVAITPYVIDMNTGIVVESNNDNANLGETGVILYSPEANGIYSGFMFTPYGWYHYFLKEGNGLMWGTAGDEGAFHITSDAGNNRQNMWFPGSTGCYYVNVNTKEATWDALYISSLTISGLSENPINLTLDKENNLWIASFTATEAGEKTITISGNGDQWNVETGTNDGAGIPVNVAFANENNNLVLADNAGNISVTIPEAGECTIKLDLINPNDRKVYVEAGGTDIPSSYSQTLDVVHYNDDGSEVALTTLNLVNKDKGIYTGTYSGDKLDFQIIDRTNSVWYGCDPNDNTKLSSSEDKWDMWFNGGNTVNVTITVNLSEGTWSYTDNQEDFPEEITMYKYDKTNSTITEKIITLSKESEGVYKGIFNGLYNFDFMFVDESTYSLYGSTWSESNPNGQELSIGAGALWIYGYDWNVTLNISITVDLNTMTWSYKEITE